MTDKKSIKGSSIVLTVKDGKEITADSFSCINFDGLTVSGDDYYVSKAVKLGAKKAK
jgi:hypothetical protein